MGVRVNIAGLMNVLSATCLSDSWVSGGTFSPAWAVLDVARIGERQQAQHVHH